MTSLSRPLKILTPAVILAALGYFVDIYDLVLFSIVRVSSLTDLGVAGPNVMNTGLYLLNVQMIGMLIGGIIWGVLGDKKGRLSVLLGSILLYSLANILNGFVTSIPMYALCRFVAGIGLAGELGAGITLVSESIDKHRRGYATALVAGIGVSGAVFAGVIAEFFTWRVNYWIGGAMGIILLLMRIRAFESDLFKSMMSKTVEKGNFLRLFSNRQLLIRYCRVILIGVPLWYIVGILITFSPELTRSLGIEGVKAGRAIMWCYGGLVIGDLGSGFISQWVKSRRKVVGVFIVGCCVAVTACLNAYGLSAASFYWLCFGLGIFAGYWALFVTMAAEQFGTNLRATVTTTVPNFVRGMVVPLTIGLHFLQTHFSIRASIGILGIICFSLALIGLYFSEESYGKDLNYLEVT